MRPWVLILLLAAAVNLNLLANGFVYDDGAQILNNPWLRSPRFLPQIFSSNVWAFIGPQGVSNYYRPLMHTLNMATFAIFGLQPWGYHLVSLLLHVGCCLLVYRIGRKLFSERVGFWGALLFAVLPIHTEAVAWVAANNDLAFTLLVLAAFDLYTSGRDAWAAVLFLPALLTKETSVMLLPLLALYQRRRTLWYFALPLGLYLALRVRALGGLTMVQNEYVLPVGQQIMSVIYLAGNYVFHLIWPLPFSVFHVFYPVTTPADPRLWGGLAILIAAVLLVWRLGPPLRFAAAWIALPLVPVLWISRVGDNVFTERYLYLPSVGFCWLVAAALSNTARLRSRLVIAVLIVYSAVTFARNREWRDDLTLYAQTLRVSPDAYIIRGNLAGAYLSGGMPEKALPLWQEVVRQRPEKAEARLSLGTTFAQLRRFPEARDQFLLAARLNPKWAAPLYNLGKVYEDLGDPGRAERAYRRSLTLGDEPGARENLGVLLAEQGHLDEAETHLRAANSLVGLGKLSLLRKDPATAERHFQQAVQADPNAAEAWYLLGRLQKDSGRTGEAEESFREMRRVLPWSKWKGPPEKAGL